MPTPSRPVVSRRMLPGALALALLHPMGVGAVSPVTPPGALQAPASGSYAATVADPARPEADRARDANRRPAEVLAFVGLAPGQKIVDYAAGAGYFTRLFAGVVGPTGHVWATIPSPLTAFAGVMKTVPALQEYTTTHPQVSVTVASALDAVRTPEPPDVFFISQFYHDLHDPFMGPVDVAAFNRAVFAALKPGGLYVVLDHVANPGSPPGVTDTLHRIEPVTARREIEAAGFVFAGESRVLANPQDPRTTDPFDASIRGRTDQFLVKFRKPFTDPA